MAARKRRRPCFPRRVRLRARSDPSNLPGVAAAALMPTAEEGWTDWQIVLKPGAEPGDLLQACVQASFALRDFEAHSATLHDVFLHLAAPPLEAGQ